MTPEQARIVILEDALIQAYFTISFLHAGLTNEKFKYRHPEQTVGRLVAWSEIVSIPVCCHSMPQEDCESCQDSARRRKLLCEAKELSE